MNGILERIQAISNEARRALADPELARASLLSALEALIDENHAHLITLGVSHPSLEKIREVTHRRGLHTKLTGAGGGGCAVTLVPDGQFPFLLGLSHTTDANFECAEFTEEALTELIQALEGEGFAPYVTSVGGSGLGILSPYVDRTDEVPDAGEGEFLSKEAPQLSEWASARGRWLYS